MFEIRELTGQEYKNVYAGKRAETEPAVVARVAHQSDDTESTSGPAGERVPAMAG